MFVDGRSCRSGPAYGRRSPWNQELSISQRCRSLSLRPPELPSICR